VKKSFLPFGLLGLVFVSLSAPAFAYLDGATGSMLIQAMIGCIAAVGMFGRHFIGKVKTTVSSIFRKDNSRRDN
jgi:hypothetical protein